MAYLVKDVVHLYQRVPQASAHNVVAFELSDIRERHRAHHHIYDAILGREPREAEDLTRQHVLSVKISMARSALQRDRKIGPNDAKAPSTSSLFANGKQSGCRV